MVLTSASLFKLVGKLIKLIFFFLFFPSFFLQKVGRKKKTLSVKIKNKPSLWYCTFVLTDWPWVGTPVTTVSLLCLFSPSSSSLVDGRALTPIVNFCILIRKRKKVILCICMHSGRMFFLPYVWALYSSCIVAVWGLDWTPLARGQWGRGDEPRKKKKTNNQQVNYLM